MSALAIWIALLGYAILWRGLQGLSTPPWKDTQGVNIGLIDALKPPDLPTALGAPVAATSAAPVGKSPKKQTKSGRGGRGRR